MTVGTIVVEWELQALAEDMAQAKTLNDLQPLLDAVQRISASANSLENEILRKMDEVC